MLAPNAELAAEFLLLQAEKLENMARAHEKSAAELQAQADQDKADAKAYRERAASYRAGANVLGIGPSFSYVPGDPAAELAVRPS